MILYRGFASIVEAHCVFIRKKAGGKNRVKDWDEDIEDRMNKQKFMNEGTMRVVFDNNRIDNFIEYTMDPKKALDFGTLCVIGIEVDDKLLNSGNANKTYYESGEQGVFLKSDVDIQIVSFRFGYFYNHPSLSLPFLMKEDFKPCPGSFLPKDLTSDVMNGMIAFFIWANGLNVAGGPY